MGKAYIIVLINTLQLIADETNDEKTLNSLNEVIDDLTDLKNK